MIKKAKLWNRFIAEENALEKQLEAIDENILVSFLEEVIPYLQDKEKIIPKGQHWRRDLKKELEQRALTNKLKDDLKKMGIVEDTLVNKLLGIKAAFDKDIQKTSGAQYDFIPSKHGIPSTAMDESRRTAFAALHFDAKGKLTPMRIWRLLSLPDVGVIQ